MHGEEDNEQDGVSSPEIDEEQCAVMFTSGAQPEINNARVCPGRKRRIDSKGDSVVCVCKSKHDTSAA